MPAIISRLTLAVGVLAIVFAVRVTAARASEITVGQAAPALIAQSFRGGKFDLSSLRGKVVVLNFWASWCEPCRSEMPLLEALSRDYGDRIVVLGLSADDSHDRRDAVKAAERVSYMTGLLSEARVNGFGAPQALPLTYVLAPSGIVSDVLRANQGAVSADRLRAAVEAALTKNMPPDVKP